jgi:hypothetical protein
VGNDIEPSQRNVVVSSVTESFGGWKVLVAIFFRDFFARCPMEHSGLVHPEFGFLSPTPRLRRELRIGTTALLFGGIAGALCVSGVVALRPSDRAATEVAEAARPAASQESELGAARSADAHATTSESHAGIAPPPASAEAPAQGSRESSATPAQAAAPASAITPKTRVVRIRETVESPAIARLPLGRSEAPAAATPPADPPASSPASSPAISAGNDAPATAPEKSASEKAVAGSGARVALANSSPPKKKVQKTVRTASSRGNDIENDSFWRNERPDWSARYAAPAGADVRGATPEKADTRTGDREGLADSSSPKAVSNASSRRNDTGNDSFWRYERTDDWSTRAAVPASADVRGTTPEKADTRTGARESLANSSPPKKAPKTVRNASSRRNDTGNDSFWREERQDDWSVRAAAANDPRNPVDRASAREGSLSGRSFWDWSR